MLAPGLSTYQKDNSLTHISSNLLSSRYSAHQTRPSPASAFTPPAFPSLDGARSYNWSFASFSFVFMAVLVID
jgi:hypothetical protein